MSKQQYFDLLAEYVLKLNGDKALDFLDKIQLLAVYSEKLISAFPEIGL